MFGMLLAFFARFGMTVGRTKIAAVPRWHGWTFMACVIAYLAMCMFLSKQFCS